MDRKFCVIDYETYSEADLKECGAYEYSKHKSTEIICVGWKLATFNELRAAPTKASPSTHLALKAIFENPDIILVAHNAFFEQCITQNVFGIKVPPERWVCTASLARALALPGSLEGAALALNLPVQKDMEGRKLILKWCKPRKPTLNDPSKRHTNSAELQRLIEYCKRDVDTETELFLRLPPLIPKERELWKLDQKINHTGFAVDRELVSKTLDLIDEETAILNKKTYELSYGVITSATQRNEVLDFLGGEGVKLSDLRKGTVDAALKNIEEQKTDAAITMLCARKAISKTSTAKYKAFAARSASDGRVRDILVYHAASTGRWGGSGVQPQNLPRPELKDTDQAADIIKSSDLETIRMIYGDPMAAFSSCIRSVIVAPEGKVLDVADYAAIEARVLFWVARHEAGLKAFREGRDLYREQAAVVFRKPLEKIGKDSFERFIGKGLILGCGYAMGHKKFAATCALQGRPVDEELAKRAVTAYRTTNHPVVTCWSNIESAAVHAVLARGTKTFEINRTKWWFDTKLNFLFCTLPSGRRLAYYKPSVDYMTTPWEERRPVLHHYGVNSVTKKWMRDKTYGGKLVENVVQGIARDLMGEAMLRIDKAGHWSIVLSVHDELVSERSVMSPVGIGDYLGLMEELPSWAEGCPVNAAGWSGKRYRK